MSLRDRLRRGLISGAKATGRGLGRASVETGRFAAFHAKQRAREYVESRFGPVSKEERRLYLEGYRKGMRDRARQMGFEAAKKKPLRLI